MNIFLLSSVFGACLSIQNRLFTEDDIDDTSTYPFGRLLSLSESPNKVTLHLTHMGPSCAPGICHSSISVGSIELYFCKMGIVTAPNTESHRGTPHYSQILGMTSFTSQHILRILRHRFQPFTYDLLRKNCNHFSEC